MATLSPTLEFSDGHRIPQLGFGVYKIPDDEATRAVRVALETGYRHIDTAAFYRNEAGVGRAVRESGIDRSEIFVTTKVWNDRHGYDETLRSFDESLSQLGLDYVDLYLIHWPAPKQDRYVPTWHALERLRDEGRARSIGVSNFKPHHIERLLAESGTTPVIDQVELHPMLPQRETREWCAAHSILVEAWSPLARGRMLSSPVIGRIAQKHGVTPAQCVIRWHLEQGLVVIPKSAHAERIRSNFDVFDFTLDDSDLAAIAGLESGERTGRDPDDDD
ncbi:MAG TPA: aldo/keto reductase [Microbacteriaceae bacterium]|nr:aldo/keto reductase [Microbacteriaceae bacterium]